MLKMIVNVNGKNYVREFDYDDMMTFVEEGEYVTVFDSESKDVDDIVDDYIEVHPFE